MSFSGCGAFSFGVASRGEDLTLRWGASGETVSVQLRENMRDARAEIEDLINAGGAGAVKKSKPRQGSR